MPTLEKFDCNTGMERVFFTTLDGKTPCDISLNSRFSVFFEIENVCQPEEARYLRVTKRNTDITVMLIKLKDDIGVKPMNGLKAAYKPKERPFIKIDVEADVETQRVIYAEEDISDDEHVAVYLHITPVGDDSDDIKRYLSFKNRNGRIHAFGDEDQDIDLDGGGGKKPLGLGFVPM